MINPPLNLYSYEPTADKQLLYAHLQNCVQGESPEQVISRFRCLFIEGTAYTSPQIREALERILSSDAAASEFKFILNRSCYILINRWQKHPRFQGAIPELISLFDMTLGEDHPPAPLPLQKLIQEFTETEEYQTLRHIAEVAKANSQKVEAAPPPEETSALGELIHRYPYLYEHCLLTQDSTDEQRQKIRLMQEQQQQKFELDLSQYITHQKKGTQSRLKAPKNPTLLSDHQLNFALQQFTDKVDGVHTYPELAQQFLAKSRKIRSYRTFKEEFYEYLINTIDPKYGRVQFNQRLYKYLQNTLPQNDSQKPSDVLLVGTCRKVLNFLVVESVQQVNHYVFLDLMNNLGMTQTVGLLLKIVLLCRQVKPYLEKRLGILFNHYESWRKDKVGWLVEALEHLNIAFAINFGSMKLAD